MRGIITLCGSVRFKPTWEETNRLLTRAGWIVLSVGEFNHKKLHDENDEEAQALKRDLDSLHRSKIDISQAIFVIDINGYIGESTAREIAHAKGRGKIIRYLSMDQLGEFL